LRLRALEGQLDRSLDPLRSALGAEVLELEPISTLRRPGPARVAYRLATADGRRFKLRVLASPEDAARIERILHALDEPRFSRVLGRCGPVLLEEWIEGQPLSEPPPPATLAEAGDLLGRVHARRDLDGSALHERESTSSHRERIASDLQTLVELGSLPAPAAQRLVDAAAAGDPGQAVTGLCHLDFCGENMLLDARGGLHVIDNEHLAVGALDYDLQRCLSRWALAPAARAAFLAAYAAHRDPELPAAAAFFWRLRSASLSACLRVRLGLERASVPIGELARMADEAATSTRAAGAPAR
jgi:Ser/Thr protein kinase RdoA (MazF antagonist)